MFSIRRCLPALLLVAIAHVDARAQDVPDRPDLGVAADTNDALAYLKLGRDLLPNDAKKAAAALYWAGRINPGLADAFYGQRIALLIDSDTRLRHYMERGPRDRNAKDFRQIDTLQYRALMLNPFFYRGFDKLLFERYLLSVYRLEGRGMRNESEFNYWVSSYLMRAPPATQAWMAYNRGDFAGAVRHGANALKQARKDDRYLLLADRARAFFLLGRTDSAEANMREALEYLRQQDEKKLVFFYESKALFEHSIGLTHEVRGNHEAAEQAYGRALQEDISYYPAHVGAARVAMARGDTAAAVSALDLAVQINPRDAVLRNLYGEALARSGKLAEAVEQLRVAIEVEPYYADSYLLLGTVLHMQGDAKASLENYRAYMDRSARSDKRRQAVEQQLQRLQAEAGG